MQTAYDAGLRAEDDRRVSLMKAHQPEPGTTDVCQCGEVCMSTSGYLLHLYDVVEDDHERMTGCDDPDD
jgi:hypothetical protein